MDKDMTQDIEHDNGKQDKIYWHDRFYAALQLELHDYKDALTFEDKHQLSKEALEMDVLVIKKMAHTSIDKNIGRIFKEHNIFEFKSETVSLSVWDYKKVMGYAMLYSAFEKVPTEDITISFAVTQKPLKLFGQLVDNKGFMITEPNPGIYYVEGDIFPIQIIENKKLTAEENVFLKNLRSNLTQKDLEEVFDAFKKYGELEKVNTYLNRVLDANLSILEEVLAMSSAAVRDVICKHLEKDGTLDRIRGEGQEEKARNIALEMLRDGFTSDKIARYVQMPLEWVQTLNVPSL